MCVGGPGKGAGGQAFGTTYLYFSLDNGATWNRSDERSKTILEDQLNKYTIQDLYNLGYK